MDDESKQMLRELLDLQREQTELLWELFAAAMDANAIQPLSLLVVKTVFAVIPWSIGFDAKLRGKLRAE